MAGRMLLTITRVVQLGDWNGFFQRLPLSLSFFTGLRVLLGLMCGRHGRRLRAVLSGIIGIEVAPVAHLDFEYQSLEVRYALLRAAADLLVHWPALFYVTCSLAKLTRSLAHSLTPHGLILDIAALVAHGGRPIC